MPDMKCIVIDPQYPKLFGKEFYILNIRPYVNSIGEPCAWYTIGDKPKVRDAYYEYLLYLGAKQIKILKDA